MIPKNKKRLKVSSPLALERQYQKEVRRFVIRIADILRERVIPFLPTLVKEAQLLRPTTDERLDNIADDVEELMRATRMQVEGEIAEGEIARTAQQMALAVNTFNKRAVTNVLKDALGVDLFMAEPWLKQELDLFAKSSVSLIKSNNAQFLNQVEQIVTNGVRQGLRHEQIAKQILGTSKDELGRVSRFRNAKTRANLIARDQVNKLNGKLTELRQKEAGIKKYIWRTNLDGRERAHHRDWNNKTFDWKTGSPFGTHPGEEINCRCYAEPVIEN